MIHQNGKFATLAIVGIVAAVFGFSLYVLLTTENTIIVINEAANEPKEVEVAPTNPQTPPTPAPTANPRIEILDTGVGFLNVRGGAATSAAKVGTVKPGEVYEYTEVKDNWYHIVHSTIPTAWVSGQYARVVNRSTDLFGGTKTAP